jgi:hypothetical protein
MKQPWPAPNRSRAYRLGYTVGRLSRRLEIPSDQRIKAWLGLDFSDRSLLTLAVLVRTLVVQLSH